MTVFALGNAIGTPLIMVATTKMDQRKQLLLALAIILLGVSGIITLPGFGLLMASRILLGIGTGVFVVAAYGLAAKLAVPGRQGRAMANVAMGYSSSLVFGVPLGRMIASTYDWKLIFWGIGIFSLFAIFTVVRTIPAMEIEEVVSLSKRLALLRNSRVLLTLCVTFFVFISYSILNTYITPFLTVIMPSMKDKLSIILLAMGIASLIGSRVGGLLADRIGIVRTLVGSMTIHIISLLMLYVVSGFEWIIVTLPLLMIWEMAAWTFGPTQNFNLVSLTPEASGIVLSLNSSFVQLGFAAGAGIGGIVAGRSTILEISWVGATSVLIALLIGVFSYRNNRELSNAQQ
ncbi:MFS transporter [Gottfriedia sp. NPDC058432]|uniref:MFS transporter n=1 Tax=Gottfriedia sp. NPDC058432 TaxID=3346497 RepID=UPI00364E26D4